jgi:hypothetical protein
MGINHTKDFIDPPVGTAYYPQKLEREDTAFIPTQTQFIVGNGGLFSFDTETYEM